MTYIVVGFARLEEALEGDLVASVGSDHGLHQNAGQSQMPALTAWHRRSIRDLTQAALRQEAHCRGSQQCWWCPGPCGMMGARIDLESLERPEQVHDSLILSISTTQERQFSSLHQFRIASQAAGAPVPAQHIC